MDGRADRHLRTLVCKNPLRTPYVAVTGQV